MDPGIAHVLMPAIRVYPLICGAPTANLSPSPSASSRVKLSSRTLVLLLLCILRPVRSKCARYAAKFPTFAPATCPETPTHFPVAHLLAFPQVPGPETVSNHQVSCAPRIYMCRSTCSTNQSSEKLSTRAHPFPQDGK